MNAKRRDIFYYSIAFDYFSVLIEDLLGKLLIPKNTVNQVLPLKYLVPNKLLNNTPDPHYNSFSSASRVKPIVISRLMNLTRVVSPAVQR